MSLSHPLASVCGISFEGEAASASEPARRPLPAAHTTAERDALFRQLMKDHRERLQRMIVRRIGNFDEAEDIAQQAFCEAARTIERFRGDSELSTWLYGIAMNLVRNYLSRSPYRHWRFDSDETLALQASEEPDPEACMYSRQMLEHLSHAIDELPVEMREVVTLVGMHDCSYESAAERLSLPIGTVRSRLSRARRALRMRLARVGIELPTGHSAGSEPSLLENAVSGPGNCRGASGVRLRPSC